MINKVKLAADASAFLCPRTREDIDLLKSGWDRSGFGEWGLELAPGFGAHHDELAAYSAAKHAVINAAAAADEARINAEADRLEIRGLYRVILEMQRQIRLLDERLEEIDGPMSTVRN